MKTSDMNLDQFGEFFLRLIKNREEVIEGILLDVERTEKQSSGLASVIPSMTSEASDANVRHQLKTCMQVQAQQAQIIRKLLMLALISASSDDFVSHVAKLAAKFGKGDEAFREFVKYKFPGLNK